MKTESHIHHQHNSIWRSMTRERKVENMLRKFIADMKLKNYQTVKSMLRHFQWRRHQYKKKVMLEKKKPRGHFL